MNAELILNLPMEVNDAGAETIRDYLKELVREVWIQEEAFSGKRPFGNSGWSMELYVALVKANVIVGELDEDGFLEYCDYDTGNRLILEAIDVL